MGFIPPERKSSLPRRSGFSYIKTLVLFCIVVAVAFLNFQRIATAGSINEGHTHGDPKESGEFEWHQITPSKNLIYHRCFGQYQCARLELPMDWNRTDGAGEKIALAIVKLPAKVPVTDKRYGGPIIVNPGGPGGSGVTLLLAAGQQLQQVADFSSDKPAPFEDQGKFFDIIGFDPRGVNNTTPFFSCFPDAQSRYEFNLQSEAAGIPGSSDTAFHQTWARAEALSAGCSKSELGSEWLGNFMNTPPVVADMVELIERHGEWREQVTEELLAVDSVKLPSSETKDMIRARNAWKKNNEKLLYWGFSYGTILGTTFAAMQPHRIHRAVIDGVCNATDYYTGSWQANLQDADSIIDKFCEYCYQAGPEACPLATGESPESIKKHLEEILASLKNDPLPVFGSLGQAPDVVTYTDLNIMIRETLYVPYKLFETLAETLAGIDSRNGTLLSQFKQGVHKELGTSISACDSNDNGTDCHSDFREAFIGISCTDSTSVVENNKNSFLEYWDTLKAQSKTMGDMWTFARMSCLGWTVEPAWRFEGEIAGQTAHPLLFIGNSRDPVTPVRNAHMMSGLFPGSAVLEQQSEGHCSLAAPSLCTAKKVRQYFQTGQLPSSDTVCEVDELPFKINVRLSQREYVMSAEDQALNEAIRELSKQSIAISIPPI